jgi:hypothetical protein
LRLGTAKSGLLYDKLARLFNISIHLSQQSHSSQGICIDFSTSTNLLKHDCTKTPLNKEH